MVTRTRRPNYVVLALAALAILAGVLWTGDASARRGSSSRLEQLVPDRVERAQLVRTLELIDRGGPFPYRKDGSVFGNRERRLPGKERGYYREYTVPTPGASTRGARRVVSGRMGERYYTRDHYRTFLRIDR